MPQNFLWETETGVVLKQWLLMTASPRYPKWTDIKTALWSIHLISTSAYYLFLHNEFPHVFFEPTRCPSPELVIFFFLYSLVRHLNISQHLCPGGSNNTGINVRAWSKIIEDTSCNSSFDEGQGFLTLQTSELLERRIWRKVTSMSGFQPLSKMAMAARLPEPIVT